MSPSHTQASPPKKYTCTYIHMHAYMYGWHPVLSCLLSLAAQRRISLFQKSVAELLNGPNEISFTQRPVGHSTSIMSEP